MNTAATEQSASVRQQKQAIRLSMIIGFLMLFGKTYAYQITGSAAILSDAAESVIHVFAVSFAAFSLWLSLKPPDASHPYGHDKISFFSAGMEGGMIILAAFYIIYVSIAKWMAGLSLQNLETGTVYTAAASLINALLGGYLVWQGKRHKSIILVANGKHVLTDSWTSFGVIIGLILTIVTGWLPFDPIVAILAALNILWSGGKLIRQSIGGLMDAGDPDLDKRLRTILDEETARRGLNYHELRARHSGAIGWAEVHLLFPNQTNVEEAHTMATEIEECIRARIPFPINVTTHLEPMEYHDEIHERARSTSG
jgi:cation diffusion facilitator family transporter